MLSSPCASCAKKGCGSYHDQCEKYAEFKNKSAKTKTARMQEVEKRDVDISLSRLMSRSRRTNGVRII